MQEHVDCGAAPEESTEDSECVSQQAIKDLRKEYHAVAGVNVVDDEEVLATIHLTL